MRKSGTASANDFGFDLPPHFAIAERRLTARALTCWASNQHRFVDDFADHSLVIDDPFGAAVIASAGYAITATFGLAGGMSLHQRDPLAVELRAACDIVALDPVPCPFEASLETADGAILLMRGIALPIADGSPERVQIILNWRELLNRSATARLRREMGAALRLVRSKSVRPDPFARDSRPNPLG